MVNLEEKSSQKSKKRIFYLDALRAMAILTDYVSCSNQYSFISLV